METEENQGSKEVAPLPFTQLAVFCYAAALVMALLWIFLRETEVLPSRYVWGLTSVPKQVLWGTAFALLFIAISLVAHVVSQCVRKGEKDLKRLLGDLSLRQIWILALVSSIGEEAFFRGAMQPSLGIWVTSVIFGAVHLPPTPNLFFYPALAAVLGVGLGWMFMMGGEGLIAPVVAHFLINLIGLYRINRLKLALGETRDTDREIF